MAEEYIKGEAIKNEYRIVGDCAEIYLQYGDVCTVDVADLGLLGGYCWRLIRKSSRNKGGYAAAKYKMDGSYFIVIMHRLIMDAPKELEVDHIDGDGLNNRRSNLRLATRSQNLANQRIGKANTSGRKGVSWDSDRKKWAAKLHVNGRTYNIGRYDDIEEASNAYFALAKEKFSEFARKE